MKRTTVLVDEDLLKKAIDIFGAKTCSEAVNRALQEALEVAKLRGVPRYAGSNIRHAWLGRMRKDGSSAVPTRRRLQSE